MRRVTIAIGLLFVVGCGGGGNTPPPGGGLGSSANTRGTLIDYSLIRDYGETSMDTVLDYIEYESGISLSVTSDVSLYKVSYWTIDFNGNPVTATGAVAIPDSPTNPSLVSYQHATVTDKTNVPSGNNDEAWAVLAVYAATGNYVVSMPDYLGMGGGSGLHPYIIASTEASASLDMIRAARTLCQKLNVSLNSELFLNGYSQGGHATMALTRLIEQMNVSEFRITATAPCAGPYDLWGSELPFAFAQPSVDTPTFLAFIVLAYHTYYNVPNDLSLTFQSPWDKKVPALFDGTHDIDSIAKVLPSSPSDLFTAAFINEVLNSVGNPFDQKLIDNSNWEWVPASLMSLFHASSDNVVSYQNSVKAYNYMSSHGADVTLVDLGTGLTHEEGFYYAIPKSRLWFDAVRGGARP